MIYSILVVLLVLWILGLLSGFGGNLIHTLVVIALVVFIWNMLTHRS